jgi:hypothetical protein
MISILKKNPEARTDKNLDTLVPIVREIEFFRLNQIDAHNMVDVCTELKYELISGGEFVFYQGDYGDKFYVILKGKVQVLVNNNEYIKQKKSGRSKKPAKQGQDKEVNKKLLRPFLADDDEDKMSKESVAGLNNDLEDSLVLNKLLPDLPLT